MSDEQEISQNEILDLVRWWEKKRITFNLFVGITGFITLFLFGLPVLFFEPSWTISRIIVYAIVVNGFYTLGWVSGILKLVYFKKSRAIGKNKNILFILGTILSVLITFFSGFLIFPLLLIELH